MNHYRCRSVTKKKKRGKPYQRTFWKATPSIRIFLMIHYKSRPVHQKKRKSRYLGKQRTWLYTYIYFSSKKLYFAKDRAFTMRFVTHSPKRWRRNNLLCNLAPASSMASTSSVVKSGMLSTSKNSCIRDTLDVVLHFRPCQVKKKRKSWKGGLCSRNHNRVLA